MKLYLSQKLFLSFVLNLTGFCGALLYFAYATADLYVPSADQLNAIGSWRADAIAAGVVFASLFFGYLNTKSMNRTLITVTSAMLTETASLRAEVAKNSSELQHFARTKPCLLSYESVVGRVHEKSEGMKGKTDEN